MNHDAYYKAAAPQPWTILGLELRPFSAGHLILLNRIESPFVGASNDEITWLDLAMAIAICSKPFEEGLALLNETDLCDQIGAWLAQYQAAGGQLDLPAKVAEFGEYLNEGNETPGYLYKEGGSEIGDVPVVQVVKAFLLSKTSMSEEKFLDRSWALSIWDFLSIQAQEGQVTLCSRETVSDAQAVAANLHRLLAEGKIKCPS